jgi:hypothetical protein
MDRVLARLCSEQVAATPASIETLMKTTLIRDEFIVALSVDLPEQARFAAVRAAIGGLTGPDHSERTGTIFRAANNAKEVQGARLQENLSLGAVTEARSAAERSPNISEALRTIDSFSLALPAEPRERTETLRTFVANRKRALQEIEGALRQSETLLPELLYLRSSDARLELETARAALDNAIRDKERALHALGLAERAHAAERESDSYAAQLAGLIEHGANLGLQDGHCPLCAAYRSPAEFNEALANAPARLAERGERLLAASGVLRDARAAVDAEEQALAIAQGGLSEVEQRRESAAQRLNSIRAIYKKHSFAGSADNPESAKQLVLAQQEQLARLERALFILDASSSIDRLTSLETRVTSLKQRVDLEASKFSNAERAVELARQIDASSRAVANQMLTEQFDTVMPLLKELYRRLRPHAEWMEIESEFGGKVRGSLNFTVGDGHNVQFLFSSGQRRAAGLAFLLAIHLSRRWCQWKSLLLDDPVQHIDDYRALNLVEVLAAIRRGGRQIIIAVEDTALADLLCRRLRSSIGEIGRRFELQASKTGTSEIGSVHDIFPMPREVLRHAQAS